MPKRHLSEQVGEDGAKAVATVVTNGTGGPPPSVQRNFRREELFLYVQNAEFIGQVDPNIRGNCRTSRDAAIQDRKLQRRSSQYSTPGKKSRRFKMKLSTLCAALLVAASVNVADAGLFRHKGDHCAPTCCAPAPTCAAPCDPTCGAPAAACAPACAAPAAACAPACAAPAAPACCAPAPVDCCAPVSRGCKARHKLAGWFKGLKKRGSHKCDDVCVEAAPACAPTCGAPVGPNCGAPCGACN